MAKNVRTYRHVFSLRVLIASLMGVVALALFLYAPASQWLSSYQHAKVIAEINKVEAAGPEEKLRAAFVAAHDYNETFLASGDNSTYFSQLNLLGNGVMGRIKIEKINVDLPIGHTSSDSVLRVGAGHMEETTLPVGGKATHAAITAHRGLAESRLFTDLDKLSKGDRFVLEVAGQVLTYEVETVRIVAPTETDWLLVDPNRDLVTLITCDPLGVNTERMLVTGVRVTPTPIADVDSANAPSNQPGFPWWIVVGGLGLVGVGILVWRSSRVAVDF